MGRMEELPADKAALAREILDNGIDAEEVLRLRREQFEDGVVDRDEAALVFALNEAAGQNVDPSWEIFFVDSLTDYFVWKQEPRGYLSEGDADFLVDSLLRDGKIDDRTEFALLIKVIYYARLLPSRVVETALEAVKETVLARGTVLFGPDARRPNVIDADDIEIIRTVLFAAGGDGSLTISAREAELVFEFNNRTIAAENAPGWQKLFVQCIANFLMIPGGVPTPPERDEAARRERWLDDLRGRGQAEIMADVSRHMVRRIVKRRLSVPDTGYVAPPVPTVAEAFAHESIDEPEAKWLIAHIKEDGVLHDNEKALLAFIKENSPSIHPSLDPLMAEAGVG